MNHCVEGLMKSVEKKKSNYYLLDISSLLESSVFARKIARVFLQRAITVERPPEHCGGPLRRNRQY